MFRILRYMSLAGSMRRREIAMSSKKFPDAKTPPNLHYNPYFANLNLAMPPPLTTEGQVSYADGTKPTVDQMAKDVAAFLVWTAEPKLENRHRAGIAVVIFLIFATVLAYLAYQQIWAEAKRKVRPTGALSRRGPRSAARSAPSGMSPAHATTTSGSCPASRPRRAAPAPRPARSTRGTRDRACIRRSSPPWRAPRPRPPRPAAPAPGRS